MDLEGKGRQCSTCKLVFSKAGFARHRRTHADRKPYACEFLECTMVFSRKDALDRHDRFHRQVFTHACTDCGKRFVQSYDLHRHKRSHERHNSMGTRPEHSSPILLELDKLRSKVSEQESYIASLEQLLQQQHKAPAVESPHQVIPVPLDSPVESPHQVISVPLDSPVDGCDCQQYSKLGSMPCQLSLLTSASLVLDQLANQLND